ncbi:photosystem II repair protein PSB27-H1, chloroplastic [Quillaja saponaria]|uniref:Photosystem II repair protein PSB27-H1, chloroplastic n=1 Tax=Quillaja saponaria TaxID=32244 RepID=A0AAD7L0H1_QUISA|nr:photosystem II repair protein PSB27-H1, chloroplastic [Quillaja saponaria]
MACPTLITPTSKPQLLTTIKPKSTIIITNTNTTTTTTPAATTQPCRRQLLSLTARIIMSNACLDLPLTQAVLASSDEEYVKETEEVINRVRTTIKMEKNDPNVAAAVADLREISNSWVAKYRREKNLLGRPSFRDIYSAINAVSGHYISFGPTAPIPAKRKARILEEVDTAEKALTRGR